MNNGIAVVLVVEDSAIIRMGAIDLVLSAGYEALEACDADEAIRILESRDDVDLVFTDVQMPGTMDGIKLSHYIRERWPPVKLIVASGATILEESSLPMGAGSSRNPTMITQSQTQWPACCRARFRRAPRIEALSVTSPRAASRPFARRGCCIDALPIKRHAPLRGSMLVPEPRVFTLRNQ